MSDASIIVREMKGTINMDTERFYYALDEVLNKHDEQEGEIKRLREVLEYYVGFVIGDVAKKALED